MLKAPDRIEKKITLRAPLDRVWQAVSASGEFGFWFEVTFDGPFVAGQRVTGRITPTQVDPDVAALPTPHEGKALELERIVKYLTAG